MLSFANSLSTHNISFRIEERLFSAIGLKEHLCKHAYVDGIIFLFKKLINTRTTKPVNLTGFNFEM